ncbi:MAG: SDR family NAD(P)-dependent oxidoreductase, partial [Limisphaerales bacterium]
MNMINGVNGLTATNGDRILRGKIAFVTGGSRGIGRAIVLALAEAGADVAFTYLQNAEKAREVCGAALEKGIRCKGYQSDVASLQDAERVIQEVTVEFGKVQI